MRGIGAFRARVASLALLCIAAWSIAGQGRPTYLLTASDDWMPYSSAKDPNGGILVMIAKAAFDASGKDTTVTLLPWARALEDAREGSQMGIIGAWYSEDRAKDFLYSDPIITNEIVFFALVDRGIKHDELKDLSPFNIGVVRGNSFIDRLMRAGLTLDYANDFETNLKKLVGARIDILADEKLATIRLIDAKYPNFKERIEILRPPLESNDLFFIVSKKVKDAKLIVADFNSGLRLISANGAMRRILAAYGVNP
jgi:polar amino acid transport system substrate-binding protein